MAKDTHTLCTFCDDCDLTLRFEGDTAHFELWIPGKEDPEPLATIPATGHTDPRHHCTGATLGIAFLVY